MLSKINRLSAARLCTVETGKLDQLTVTCNI